jgi:hypothetical protein
LFSLTQQSYPGLIWKTSGIISIDY